MELAASGPAPEGGGTLRQLERFATDLKTLRSLNADLLRYRAKRSAGEQWLLAQIARLSGRCAQLAEHNTDVAPLWAAAQAELLPPATGQ